MYECCNAPRAKNTIPKQTAQGKVQNKLTGLELSDWLTGMKCRANTSVKGFFKD